MGKSIIGLLVTILLCASAAQGRMGVATTMSGGGSTAASQIFILSEDFNHGTDTPPSGWSSPDNAPDNWSYATSPLEGAGSLYTSWDYQDAEYVFSEQTEIYTAYEYSLTGFEDKVDYGIYLIMNGIDTATCASINVSADGSISVHNLGGTTKTSATGAISANIPIFLKMKMTQGTGSNASVTGWYSTSGAVGMWTMIDSPSTNGTSTTATCPIRSIVAIQFIPFISQKYDKIRVSTTDINY